MMTAGSLLLGLALLALVGLFVARPFLMPQKETGNQPLTKRQLLLAQKETLLEQIRTLDFDHDTGKIPDEAYTPERARLMAEAAVTLQQLDEIAGSEAAVAGDVDVEIEAAVARLRLPKPEAKKTKTGGKGRFCTQCGRPTDPGDKFCASCGQELLMMNNE